jgi:hypothetical protein
MEIIFSIMMNNEMSNFYERKFLQEGIFIADYYFLKLKNILDLLGIYFRYFEVLWYINAAYFHDRYIENISVRFLFI